MRLIGIVFFIPISFSLRINGTKKKKKAIAYETMQGKGVTSIH